MPEDRRRAGTVLSRLELIEEKLDNVVLEFCTQGQPDEPLDRIARTIWTLLRDSQMVEEMKKKYDSSGSENTAPEHDPAEIAAVKRDLKRRILQHIGRGVSGPLDRGADPGGRESKAD